MSQTQQPTVKPVDIESNNRQQTKEAQDKTKEKELKPVLNGLDCDQGYGIIGRLFMLNLIRIAFKVKAALNRKQPLTHDHIPILRKDQKIELNSKVFTAKLENEISQRALTPMKVFRLLMSGFTMKSVAIIIYQIFDTSFKLFSSVSLNFCIEAIIDSDKKRAYIWGSIMLFCMLMSTLMRLNCWQLGFNLNAEIRGTLVNTIYNKVNRLSGYSVKSASMSKIVNLISSDMNTTEAKFFYLYQMIIAPYTLIAACVIQAFRLGPLGILSIVFLFFVFPVQKWLGKVASRYTQKRVLKSDERIKIVNEIIEGIRIIKIYGWEEAIKQIVEKLRREEVRLNMKAQIFMYLERAFSVSSVLLSATITFIIVYYQGSYSFNTANIYSTIDILSYIRSQILIFSGGGFSYIFELQIFLRRFIEIYSVQDVSHKEIEEQQDLSKFNTIKDDEIARLDNFSAFWKVPTKQQIQKLNQNNQQATVTLLTDQNEKDNLAVQKKYEQDDLTATLNNLSFGIKKGELISVVGKIGSGKSTFLNCFLKEIPYYTGYFKIRDKNDEGQDIRMAYVEQEPYIFSSTVKENILFGKEFNQQWYDRVVKDCCLTPDFAVMEKGDQTVVGERGVNLSGGQKARICLARAVYSNADIYLLDDPLSAVDSKVAKELFHNCIRGILSSKTVILVTHQIHFTRNCDKIVILEDNGSVRNMGVFDDLQDDLVKLAAGLLKFEAKGESENRSRKSVLKSLKEEVQKRKTISSKADLLLEPGNKEQREEIESEDSQEVQVVEADKKQEEKQQIQTNQEIVTVTYGTYYKLFKLISSVICGFPLFVVIFFVGCECIYTTYNLGLGRYDSTSDNSKGKLFGFLIGFVFLYMIFNAIKLTLISQGIQLGNEKHHHRMLTSLMRAPVLFFDRTSSGSLMNKFSNDISLIDNVLHYSLNDSIDIMCNFLNLLITCCVINPYIVIPAVCELFLLFQFMIYNKEIIVKIRQMDLAQKTPVFQYFSQTLSGIVPIKVYGQNKSFLEKMIVLCNNSESANMAFWLCSRYFGGMIQIIATLGSAVGVYMIISMPSDNPNLSAQSITYFILMVDTIQWCLRQILATDSYMSSFERSQTLANLEPEAPLHTDFDSTLSQLNKDSMKIKQSWPAEGGVEFSNVVMKYSKELNPVLKGLTFKIQSGSKVGVIGRTGAGKSSVLQTLFRLTEPEQGSEIKIDGVDISKLGLHKLRQNISIIPQIPFVFAGTIRRNIDPLNLYSDREIWDALQLVELDKYIQSNCKDGLQTDMTVASSVFSVGQKQLICLARALLKNNKLLVLDEATANVDMETDNLIQTTIREKFELCTVLTIAHRLNTIADYDQVMVMDNGVVAEIDVPFKLLANSTSDENITKNTIFSQMVKNTGKNNAQNIFNISKQKYLSTQNQNELCEL